MGGRDATNHIGLVAETPSDEVYEAAAKTLSRLCARAGGTADDLRNCLEAIGYPTALKTRESAELARARPAPLKKWGGLTTGKRGGREVPVRKVPGTDLCGNRIHHMVGDNLGTRRDGRRYCKPCARNRNARRRASRQGREHPEHIKLPEKDPNLCANQLHPRTPENLMSKSGGRTACRLCNVLSQRARRAATK